MFQKTDNAHKQISIFLRMICFACCCFVAFYSMPLLAYDGPVTLPSQPAPPTPKDAAPIAKKPASQADFQNWFLNEFSYLVAEKKVQQTTLHQIAKTLKFMERSVKFDNRQAETKATVSDYLQKRLSKKRIQIGVEKYRKHRTLLKKIEAKYGVPGEYLVALWGLESYYGQYPGKFSTLSALATLAYDGWRTKFFKRELASAIMIVDQGHISAKNMKGSWAGATGNNQFMPTTFMAYAQDFNGDGKKNIWRDLPDIFASSAYFLKELGWQDDYIWGRAVQYNGDYDHKKLTVNHRKNLTYWQGLGVKRQNGHNLPKADIEASLIQPDGPKTQYYLVYNNYRTILKWNRSHFFALSVGLLADEIRKANP